VQKGERKRKKDKGKINLKKKPTMVEKVRAPNNNGKKK